MWRLVKKIFNSFIIYIVSYIDNKCVHCLFFFSFFFFYSIHFVIINPWVNYTLSSLCLVIFLFWPLKFFVLFLPLNFYPTLTLHVSSFSQFTSKANLCLTLDRKWYIDSHVTQNMTHTTDTNTKSNIIIYFLCYEITNVAFLA
mgnify:CR=1 FL=1